MSEPRISVYLPSHNYGRFVGAAIESVLRQSVDDWELIVIDDNSTDSTPRELQRYHGDPRISFHRTAGIGLPAVCNYALAQSRGRYVIRLDGDDLFDENILLVLGAYLDRNPDVALVFPDYYLIDENGDVFSQHRRRRPYEVDHMLDLPPNGAGTMIRRGVIKEMGGYREDLGAQDGFDLWTKIRGRHKMGNVSVPLFYYRRHGKNLTTDHRRILAARQTIKRDGIRGRLSGLRPVTAIIPCRRHYDFTPDLWKQPVNGRSLLERDIDVCLSVELFDHVVVACDNEEAEAVVRRWRNPRLRFFPRNPRDTLRTASIVPTLERIVRDVDPELGGITVLRYIQTPFVTAETLEEAITTLVLNDADSAFALEEITSPLYRRTPHGLEPVNQRGEVLSDFDQIYRDPQTCVAVRNRHLPSGSLTGPAAVGFVVSSAECFFIDSAEDLRLAALMATDNR